MNENIVDKRVYKTLTKIENGMIRLLEDKPYKDINVKDICRESGISRGTFINIIQIKMIFISISKRNDKSTSTYTYMLVLKFMFKQGQHLLLVRHVDLQ